ncbi:MAG: hypothetical protein L0219_09740 [Phycisphaerales bacterium]|nr:hypothetical protein [Phycisphaerales bacterium]MCI0676523.1 hypothetical protein [Phycisphaerales bacterium]
MRVQPTLGSNLDEPVAKLPRAFFISRALLQHHLQNVERWSIGRVQIDHRFRIDPFARLVIVVASHNIDVEHRRQVLKRIARLGVLELHRNVAVKQNAQQFGLFATANGGGIAALLHDVIEALLQILR